MAIDQDPARGRRAQALQQGEIDWFEQPPPELQTLLRGDNPVRASGVDAEFPVWARPAGASPPACCHAR